MIETYAFLAMFTIQILVGSVVGPTLVIRRVQPKVAKLPVARFAKLFPGVDRNSSGKRFATRYRTLNLGIAVIGLFLLGWLFIHVGYANWSEDRTGEKVVWLLTLYFLVQVAPGAFVGWKAGRSMKALKASLAERKRKAVLQRRGLFDFVSPFLVFLAIFSYALLVGLVLYIRQHPFPGFGGLTNIAIVTLIWVFFAFLVYGWLYGRNRVPLATHADRLYVTGMTVKTLVYTGISVTVLTLLELTLSLLHLQRWGLFAVSVFFVISMSLSAIAPWRRPTDPTKHKEICLPVAELDKCVGRYELGENFTIAVARDDATLWVLRLNAPGQPAPIFPEAPLSFFWKVFDAQLRFTADASGEVTRAELTTGTHVFAGNRV